MTDLLVPASDRVHFAAVGFFGQIDRELLQCLLFTHLGWCHGTTGLAGYGTTADLGTVGRMQIVFRRTGDNFIKTVGQCIDFYFVEFFRNCTQAVAQARCFEHADD